MTLAAHRLDVVNSTHGRSDHRIALAADPRQTAVGAALTVIVSGPLFAMLLAPVVVLALAGPYRYRYVCAARADRRAERVPVARRSRSH
jgi:hypothetical protein